jgi:uncharacterized protein YndB with AHSA1/START domain
MIKFSFTTKISRTPPEVFAYLADPSNLGEWQGTDEVEQLSEGPIGVGTRFREAHIGPSSRIESITEVTDYEPGEVFGVRVIEGPVPVDGRWELEATEAGTRLRFSASGRGPGPSFLGPVVGMGMKRHFKRQHEQLRRAIEARPAEAVPGPPSGGSA